MHLPFCFASLLASAWFTQPTLLNVPSFWALDERASSVLPRVLPGVLPGVIEDESALAHAAIAIDKLQGVEKGIQAKSIQSGKIQNSLSAAKGQDLLTAVTEHDLMVGARWLTAWGVLLAGGALAWGISHYIRQQQWQRLEFLRQIVKEFEQDLETRNALKILDFEEYRGYCMPGDAGHESVSFRVDEDLLCNAL